MAGQTVRSGATGERILCCWSDCDRRGYHNFEHIQYEGTRKVHYLFCCPRHRAYWRDSIHSNGNLASGNRSMSAPR